MPLGTKEAVPICSHFKLRQALAAAVELSNSKPLTARAKLRHCNHQSDPGETWAYGKRRDFTRHLRELEDCSQF